MCMHLHEPNYKKKGFSAKQLTDELDGLVKTIFQILINVVPESDLEISRLPKPLDPEVIITVHSHVEHSLDSELFQFLDLLFLNQLASEKEEIWKDHRHFPLGLGIVLKMRQGHAVAAIRGGRSRLERGR